MATRTAFLFPGQGAYLPGVLSGWIDEFPQVRDLLDTVDGIAAEYGHESVAKLLCDPVGTPLDELLESGPEMLDLAIYAIDAAAYEILVGLGLRADVLAGHSFGELAALTSAEAVTPADATRIVCERAAAFRAVDPPTGGMTALALGARRAGHLVGLLDDPVVSLAVDNGPGQSVLSGPVVSLEEVERLAGLLGVRATRLRTAYAFHNPLLHGVTRVFTEATREVPLRRPRIPVYSATLGRYLRDATDVRTLVTDHMVLPVGFYDGLLQLLRDGVQVFVEAGARQALTGLVRGCLPAGPVAAPLLPRRGSSRDLAETLRQAGVPVEAVPVRPAVLPRPAPKAPSQVLSQPSEPPRTTSPAPSPEPATRTGGLPPRLQLILELRELYAEQLGYPRELVTEDIDLEADLGIDSIKQIEVFGNARTHFGLPKPPADLRITTASTLEGIADLLLRIAAAGTPAGE